MPCCAYRPLIRILGDRFPWQVKSAILSTLTIIIAKGGLALKPFLPQLQTTFVKCLQDSNRLVQSSLSVLLLIVSSPFTWLWICRSVRTRAASALGKLSALSTRVDPLVSDLLSMLQVFRVLPFILVCGGRSGVATTCAAVTLFFFSQGMMLLRKVWFLHLKVLLGMLVKVLVLQSDRVGVLFSKICCRLMLMMSVVLLRKQLAHYLRYCKLWHFSNWPEIKQWSACVLTSTVGLIKLVKSNALNNTSELYN